MSSRGHSTKETLLQLVDDIETISKEMLESIIAPKPEKLSHAEQTQLIQLIMAKNEDLRDSLKIAEDQAEIDRKMSDLAVEVSRHDQDIQMLQKHLKEAETLLSTALYQARLKLDQITKAQTHSVNSEDLIRFAHRISSTNAVAAPTNWLPGDPRRPYPTDLEMRMGLLARLNELPMNQVRKFTRQNYFYKNLERFNSRVDYLCEENHYQILRFTISGFILLNG
ncbi:Mediator of RNA polymerase II transcription subunit 4 [Folsomia candida]|uniref:Mediator of RNA polymerase II transcription subunit 4 n=1 Tax=Folsomia candida TaxID=158441 RepID=A0A226EUI8_FOLCA|nr:Mediator of RNA polymerase II transcription subunit 4 [Folsomia candida]